MPAPAPQKAKNRRPAPRLDASKARGLAVERMSDSSLWTHLLRELDRAIQHGEAWEGRQAFYASARARACATELYLRGTQLSLGKEFFEGEDRPRYAHPTRPD